MLFFKGKYEFIILLLIPIPRKTNTIRIPVPKRTIENCAASHASQIFMILRKIMEEPLFQATELTCVRRLKFGDKPIIAPNVER
jgi:hypothetical protein